ncbi:MAG TPA: DUF6521 family protein [Bacillota bacterium]|nr:DUF6521 family protein [Bacillota bacterium]
MIAWNARAAEERHLLNPSFCGLMLWEAAGGYRSKADARMPIPLAFLVLPIVLHRETRETLPRALATSLPVWLGDYPLIRTRIVERTRALVPFSREALLFGGLNGLLSITADGISVDDGWRQRVTAALRSTSDEVRECGKKAGFLGKWFERAGSPETVMALFGVKP